MVVGMVFWGVVTGHVLGMVFRFDFIFSWRVLGQGEKFIALFLAREDFSPGATPPKTNEKWTFFEGVNFSPRLWPRRKILPKSIANPLKDSLKDSSHQKT